VQEGFSPVRPELNRYYVAARANERIGKSGFQQISDGCGGLLRVQSDLICFPQNGSYQPTVYAYTDPIGWTYTISASGQLQSSKIYACPINLVSIGT